MLKKTIKTFTNMKKYIVNTFDYDIQIVLYKELIT